MEDNYNSDIQLPPGFRFRPSDQELMIYYLKNKATSSSLPASVIAEVDLYKCDPWELPSKALFGEEEWYFFTPRDKKYPNGVRPNRTTASGYWKATGTDKPILSSCGAKILGVKKALVFYKGRPPKGAKTEWIMHEYRLPEPLRSTSKQKGCMRLDDWVLCRVKQNNNIKRTGEANYAFNNRPFESQKGDRLCSTNTNANLETIRDFLYRECMAPASIFASPDLPMDTGSSISYETSKTSPSVCEDNSNTNYQSQGNNFNASEWRSMI